MLAARLRIAKFLARLAERVAGVRPEEDSSEEDCDSDASVPLVELGEEARKMALEGIERASRFPEYVAEKVREEPLAGSLAARRMAR